MILHMQSPGAGKEALAGRLRAAGLDGLLLCSPENVFYTTGFPAIPGTGNPILFALRNQLPFFAYIDASGRTTLLCWIGATMGFSFDADEVRSFFNLGSALDELRDFLHATLHSGHSGAKIGVESSCPYYAITALEQSVGTQTITIADDLLLGLRLVKTEEEIARISQATAVVEQTVADLRALIQPGISRLWLIGEAKRLMIQHGAHGIGHTTIGFGASNPEIAFDETLEEHQLVTLDLGALVDGYASDNRRLFYTGALPADLLQLHASMCDIVSTIGDALLPGVTFADLYARATELYEARGLPPFFISVGHSIGLQTEEAWITFDSPETVQAGMVLNIELYSPYADGSSVGDEETFLVTPAGSVRLTSSDPAIQGLERREVGKENMHE